MSRAATEDTDEGRRSDRRPSTSTVRWLLALAGLAGAGWFAFCWLGRLPVADEHHDLVLYYLWGHGVQWWQFLAFAAASAATVGFATLLMILLVRCCAGYVQGLVAAVLVLLWFLGAAFLGVCTALVSIDADTDLVVVRAPDGARVILAQQLIEPTRYRVYAGDGGSRFVEVNGAEVVSGQLHSCALNRPDGSHLRLTCGSANIAIGN